VNLCTVCGVVTSRAGSRCTEHARQSNRSRHNALYGTRAWQRLSARVLRAWRGEHGNWCPGYGRPAHRASDLTVDHVVPLAAGGAPFDIANTAVLCRSCNSTKGASTDRGGVAHTAKHTRPDRGVSLAPSTASKAIRTASVRRPVERDPLVAALTRYVEALHRRYPEGPEQLRRERLAAARNRANVVVMDVKREAGAA
jgi:5-methylcytosine-specific restriction protein A